MSFTPLLCTVAEIALFTKDVTAQSIGLTSEQLDGYREILHQSAQSQILQYLNRIDLTAEDLTGNTVMASILKLANIAMVSNWLVWWKQQRAGKVIDLGDMVVKLLSPDVFTDEIKKMIQPFKAYQFKSVDPDETIAV